MRFFNFGRRQEDLPAWEAATPEQLQLRALPLLKLCASTLEAVECMMISPGSSESTEFEKRLGELRNSIGDTLPSVQAISEIRRESRDSIREMGLWQRREVDQLQKDLVRAIQGLVQELRVALRDQQNLLGDFGDFQNRLETIQSSDDIREIKNGLCSEINVAKRILEWQTDAHTRLQEEYASAVQSLENKIDALRCQSGVDLVTGTYNRTGFEEQFELAKSAAETGSSALTVGVIDIDGFRQLNSENGRQAGDEMLALFGQHLGMALGQDLLLARIGKDEFGVLFNGFTGLLEKRLQSAFKSMPAIRLPGEAASGAEIRLKASAGLTSVLPQESHTEVFQRAESALFEAKRDGGNCIRVRESKKKAA